MENINQKLRNRSSNLELYRILTMLLIVAHHYVVNSGVLSLMYENPMSVKAIFLFIFGMWGKIGINCFVLITGYFMCKSTITINKFIRLIIEVEFYKIGIYIVFVLCGYEKISILGVTKGVLPIMSIQTNYVGCFLVFYLCIPFLNILIKNMNKIQHILLIALLTFTYVFMGSIPKFSVTMNYVSWFICLYMIASYIRLYPNKIFQDIKVWGICTVIISVLCILSVLVSVWIGAQIDKEMAYYFVTDSNAFLAVCMGVSSFLFFLNFKIKKNRVINMVASSTFGVLLIHANSDTMRKWLWETMLNVKEIFYENTSIVVLHACLSVIIIFIVCIIIDQIRMKIAEGLIDEKVEKRIQQFWDKQKKTYR